MRHGTTKFQVDPALLQRLKGVELKSRFLVRGLYSNRHRTADRGLSTEFVEHREYRRGDELRTIDWRVMGRTDRFYVKVHEMESNMRVHLVLDTSASMRVPPPAGAMSKLEVGAVIAGAVAIMVETQQDSVGLTCIGDQIDQHIPAKQGKAHLSLLYQHLGNPPGDGGGRFGDLVSQATGRLGTRCVVFLITDGLDNPDQLLRAMQGLRVREHDVTLVQVLDHNEVEFPFDRMTEFRHPESGARIVGDPADLRARYHSRLAAHLETIEGNCKRAQADYVRLHNRDDLAKLLTLHFVRRMAQGGR